MDEVLAEGTTSGDGQGRAGGGKAGELNPTRDSKDPEGDVARGDTPVVFGRSEKAWEDRGEALKGGECEGGDYAGQDDRAQAEGKE